MNAEPLLFTEHLRKLAQTSGGKVAVREAAGGQVTYAELVAALSAFAAGLAATGVRRGDRVALAMRPSLAQLIAILGCLARGAVVTSLNIRLTAAELTDFLAPLSPSLLVCDPEHEPLARAIGGEVQLLANANDPAPIRERLAPLWSDGPAPQMIDELEYAIIIPTGGTTGLPKGAAYTQRAVWLWAAACAFEEGRSRQDHELYFSPFFHSSILSGWIATLFAGGEVTLLDHFSADHALEAIARGASFVLGPPTVFQALLTHPDFRATDRSRVSKLRIATTATTPAFIEQLMAEFPAARLSHTYGASEFGPVANIGHDDFLAGRLAGVGRVRPGARVTIVDAELRPLPPGEEGELVVDCAWRSRKYWGREAETQATYTDLGVRIGDVGRLDASGWLTISGRKKEIIISGGENVFPNEVEMVLSQHPAVEGIIVYGASDAYWGERVEAVVVLRPGSALSQEELIAFGRPRLGGYKLPKRVRFVAELPLTSMNKPDRLRLSREAAP
ncbi:MAG: long-chain fatty acid--CoA ligase [Phenylobacterium sp.]|nr:long-chain fatty acid--CoA ligase [Phenylobacterium sp.]